MTVSVLMCVVFTVPTLSNRPVMVSQSKPYQLVVRHDLRRMLTHLPRQIGCGRGVVGDMVAKETANVLVLYLFLRHAFQDSRPACVDEVKKNINKKTNKGKHPTKQKPSKLTEAVY